MQSILVIEDELAISKMICMHLEISGYHVTPIYCGGSKAETIIQDNKNSSLALLDVMLPEGSGFDLLQLLSKLNIPVIFLTAKDDIESKVRGLTNGAEDYIVKPFEILELLVRIDKVLSRSGAKFRTLNKGDLEINIEERIVLSAGNLISLTPLEFDLLSMLVANKNMALSREKLLDEVWGVSYEGGTRTVDVHIAQIRKKTGLNIIALPKIGYRLED